MSDLGNREVFAENLSYYMDRLGKDRAMICAEIGGSTMLFVIDVVGKNQRGRPVAALPIWINIMEKYSKTICKNLLTLLRYRSIIKT